MTRSSTVSSASAHRAASAKRAHSTRSAFPAVRFPQLGGLVAIVAAICGLPLLVQYEEQGRAATAYDFLRHVRQTQQQYRRQHGTFAAQLDALDLAQNPPAYFAIGRIKSQQSGDVRSWSLTLTRRGAAFHGFEPYTITFNDRGFDPLSSSVDRSLLASATP